jgi:hypothetical protein
VSENTYTVERIPVNRLEVDPRVQRDQLKMKKVMEIEKNFNPDAAGVLYVSRRKDTGLYIIDGWHRKEAMFRKDPTFEATCWVFEGLTLVQEALMFLDLNYADKPTQLDKYKVRLAAEDPDSLLIEQITTSRGWKVHPNPAPSHIQAVSALYRILALSEKVHAEPHLLDMTLLVITRAWGVDQHASQAVILEGIAQVLAEYGDKLNPGTLVDKLRDRGGGPRELHTNATALAATRNGRVVNAVSELVVATYNRGLRGRGVTPWRTQS